MERKIDRFDKYMTYKGLNDNKITVALELSIGTLGKSRKNGRDLSDRVIELILNFYKDLNPFWLLTGDGEMLLTEKKEPQKVESIPSGSAPSEILEELRENYLVKEERLLAIIESQQEVIRNQSELMKKIAVRPEGNVICADAAGSDFKK